MSYPCGTSLHPKNVPRLGAYRAAPARSKGNDKSMKGRLQTCLTTNKLDIVIVDSTKRDKCLVAKGPALVERAWIMSRPPAELLIDHKLVSARKMQLVRDLINCWTGEYTRVQQPPPPPPEVIRNCELKTRYCMMYDVNNCSKSTKPNTCVYEP